MFYQLGRILFIVINLTLIIHKVLSQKKTANLNIAEVLHRPIRTLASPENSNMGANYALPANISFFEPWIERKHTRRSIDRAIIYRVLESKFHSSGYPGRNCLLRAVCETSEFPLQHNGIIGDILHVVFTPSTSKYEKLPEDIIEAELVGRKGNCSKYQPQCPLGIFDLIGIFAISSGILTKILDYVRDIDIGFDIGITGDLHIFTEKFKLLPDKTTKVEFPCRHLPELPIMSTSSSCNARNTSKEFLFKIIFFALGIPIDIPDKSISVSFYFEANYGLPYEWNLKKDYFAQRTLNRRLIYKIFISKMESLGYPGLDCLLKIICEVERFSLKENGVLGDILHIIFTPSMSKNEDLSNEIIEAEYEQHCNQRYKRCSLNLLDLVSHYINDSQPTSFIFNK